MLYVPNIAKSCRRGLAGAIYGVILLLVIFVMPAGAAGFVAGCRRLHVALAQSVETVELGATLTREDTMKKSDPPHDPRRRPGRAGFGGPLLTARPARPPRNTAPASPTARSRSATPGPIAARLVVRSPIPKSMAAYFKMINDQGGINGRKINFISYDDAYSPPKTVEMARKLVEEDEVLLHLPARSARRPTARSGTT